MSRERPCFLRKQLPLQGGRAIQPADLVWLPNELEFEAGDTGGEVQAGLLLNRNWLEYDRAAGPPNQHIRPKSGDDRCFPARAHIFAGETAHRPRSRRIHNPDHHATGGGAQSA